MNAKAAESPVGSKGLLFYPFGNGAERILENKNFGGSIEGFNFNIHTQNDVLRAAQEGIVFSLVYGIEIMNETGIEADVIRAGKANMFLSRVFTETLAGTTGAVVELYNTDGAEGAARGAGIGAGIYKSFDAAFKNLKRVDVVNIPEPKQNEYKAAYSKWKKDLKNLSN
jgi:xylulokinase